MSVPKCQTAQVVCGARTKHVGLSHRDMMTGIKADVQSDAMKDLMQRLVAMNTSPAILEARQGEEDGGEPEESIGAASSATTWQSEQNWWQGWQGWQERPQGAWDPESVIQVVRTAEAKPEATSNNRAAQKQHKAAKGIANSALKLG